MVQNFDPRKEDVMLNKMTYDISWCKAHFHQRISRDTGKMENCNLLQLTHNERSGGCPKKVAP
ncbi:hypothetical protein T10_3353 [Trichinella papuae]|uniref:Uncharacterized protein n=1 Tax=Trichinella papuae TaxID=268474 RepID=A0A0V1LZP2_9BILA|nr:hypothetical protein T10_3353 [Trichinella papuae]